MCKCTQQMNTLGRKKKGCLIYIVTATIKCAFQKGAIDILLIGKRHIKYNIHATCCDRCLVHHSVLGCDIPITQVSSASLIHTFYSWPRSIQIGKAASARDVFHRDAFGHSGLRHSSHKQCAHIGRQIWQKSPQLMTFLHKTFTSIVSTEKPRYTEA